MPLLIYIFSVAQSGTLVVDRRGVMMMKFLPAIGERKYDSEKRQVTFLSFPPLPFFLVITPLFVLLTLVKDENILQ